MFPPSQQVLKTWQSLVLTGRCPVRQHLICTNRRDGGGLFTLGETDETPVQLVPKRVCELSYDSTERSK